MNECGRGVGGVGVRVGLRAHIGGTVKPSWLHTHHVKDAPLRLGDRIDWQPTPLDGGGDADGADPPAGGPVAAHRGEGVQHVKVWVLQLGDILRPSTHVMVTRGEGGAFPQAS